MAVPTDAQVTARAVLLWPGLSVVGSGVLTAWVSWCRAQAGQAPFSSTYHLDALAHLLAHAMYAGNPDGSLATGGGPSSTGGVTSTSTIQMSASWGASGIAPGPTAYSLTDAALATTAPGRAYLALRDTRPAIVAPFVAVP